MQLTPTIHSLLAGRELPTKGDLLFEVVKFLHHRNRHQRKTEDAVLDELDALWGPATRRDLSPYRPLPLSAAALIGHQASSTCHTASRHETAPTDEPEAGTRHLASLQANPGQCFRKARPISFR